jgi:hypothetical protein
LAEIIQRKTKHQKALSTHLTFPLANYKHFTKAQRQKATIATEHLLPGSLLSSTGFSSKHFCWYKSNHAYHKQHGLAMDHLMLIFSY